MISPGKLVVFVTLLLVQLGHLLQPISLQTLPDFAKLARHLVFNTFAFDPPSSA